MLEPRLVGRDPELIGDGGGLPFTPAALARKPRPLDPKDPAVGALIARLSPQQSSKVALRKRDAPAATESTSLEGWRLLARSDSEALFGRGQPPELVTVAVQKHARRGMWQCSAVTKARPLRATRDGIRASSWRLDPNHELKPEDTVLRVLVTEQTFSGAERATGRVQAPDLHVDSEELVLTMFVTPRPGFQLRVPNPETPVRVALTQPVGTRWVVDGALYGPDV